MKTTLTILPLVFAFVGFTLVSDALAQSDNPSPAAAVPSGDGSAAGDTAPEDTKPDATEAPSESQEPGEGDEAAPKEGEAEDAEESGEADTAAPTDVIDQGKGFYGAVKGGHILLAIGFAAMFLASVGRWLASLKWDFWKTKRGGYASAVITGLGVLGWGLVSSGGAFSLDLLSAAVSATLIAMGLHSPAKDTKNAVKTKAAATLPKATVL